MTKAITTRKHLDSFLPFLPIGYSQPNPTLKHPEMMKSEDLAFITQLRVYSRILILNQSKSILSADRLHLRRWNEPGLSHRRFYSVELLRIFFKNLYIGGRRKGMQFYRSRHESPGYDGMTSCESAFPASARGACG